MSLNTISVNFPTKSILSAFAKEAATNAIDELITEWTLNGDITFGSMGNGPKASMLALDNKMVRNKNTLIAHKPVARKPVARKRSPLVPTETTETTETNKINEIIKLLSIQKYHIDIQFDCFVREVMTLPPRDQAYWWTMMFRYMFYLRNSHGEGKREKTFSYYLFEKLHSYYPKTAAALVPLFPDFGYFKDLDYLISRGKDDPDWKGIVDAAIKYYADNLNANAIQVFGCPINKIDAKQAVELNSKLKKMTSVQLTEFKKGMKLNLAPKWFKREGKKDEHIELFIEHLFFPNGGFSEFKTKNPELYKKRFNYNAMRLRHIITALTQCLNVGEQLMTSKPNDPTSISRNWQDIDIPHSPAGFNTRYRKALLNESLKDENYNPETGNRTQRLDRIQCRKNTLQAIVQGTLKGGQTDLDILANIISKDVSSFAERALISQQYNDLVANVKKMVDDAVQLNIDNPDFLDPREVIPVVDTSGSMACAKVDNIAILLGLVATSISTLPGCMISFSDKPEAFMVDLTTDVFDQYKTIRGGPTGLNTNVDATFRLVLDMMEQSGTTKSSMALLYLTDGQFDRALINFDHVESSYQHNNTDTKHIFENVFLGRMEKAFNDKGFNLPRIIFWNLYGKTPSYTAPAEIQGVQMVSGFSQTIMNQIFTGEYKFIKNNVTGNTRVNIDPWTSFSKAITGPTYEPVLRTVLETREFIFGLI
jgi:hypothetical protein